MFNFNLLNTAVTNLMIFWKSRVRTRKKISYNYELTPKSPKPLNPLKGILKSSLIFSELPFRGQG